MRLDEISTSALAKYKTAASKQASEADKRGNTEKANKRFSGIVKATKKQFDNETKKSVKESNDGGIIVEAKDIIPDKLYYGTREAMIAEIGSGDYHKEKFLVQALGDAQWEAEGANTVDELKELVKWYKFTYPEIEVFRI
jgi:hypothetical protein